MHSALSLDAVVRPFDLVLLDKRLAGTELATTAQSRIESLQSLQCITYQQQERHVAQVWLDVIADLRLVVHPCGRIDFVLREQSVEQGTECRFGTRHFQRGRFGE